MGLRETRRDRTARLAGEQLARVRTEVGRARRTAGLSIEAVARTCGMHRTSAMRILTGATTEPRFSDLVCLADAVGLDVSLRAYPAADPIRDIAHVRLLGRLRSELPPNLRWRTEVPIPLPGDRRAWDALIVGHGWQMAVEAETVLDDLQALDRRLALKRRDAGVERMILLVADTARNRRALAVAPGAFTDLPLRSRELLTDLRAGREPRAGGIAIR